MSVLTIGALPFVVVFRGFLSSGAVALAVATGGEASGPEGLDARLRLRVDISSAFLTFLRSPGSWLLVPV